MHSWLFGFVAVIFILAPEIRYFRPEQNVVHGSMTFLYKDYTVGQIVEPCSHTSLFSPEVAETLPQVKDKPFYKASTQNKKLNNIKMIIIFT